MPSPFWSGPVPPARCPGCRRELDAATSLYDDDGPRADGCATLCLYCGTVAMFTAGLQLRPPTPAELEQLLADDRMSQAMATRRAYWATVG